MPPLKDRGLTLDLPPGWEGEIYRRPPGRDRRTHPVLHAANFPLRPGRGDFGSGAVELMTAGHVFVSLFEYGPEAVGTALFAKQGLPDVRPEDFNPHTMQRPLPGQAGSQYFFTFNGRAFCLYVALGSHRMRGRVVPLVNEVLRTLRIEAGG